MPTARGHLIMKPIARDRANIATIADHLRPAGREPNTADIIRHALQVAADAINNAATESDRAGVAA